MTRTAAFLTVLVALLALAAVPASAARYVAGSEGSGDPFFPLAGNGGYDVRHYSLRIDYDQPANSLEGTLSSGRAQPRTCIASTSTCAIS